MGCCGKRKEFEPEVLPEHKFDYINLKDFNSHSCLDMTAYAWIYFDSFLAVATFAADIYTVVTLLSLNTWTNTLFKDQEDGTTTHFINFKIARIIFLCCIFFSFALLGFEWFRANRVLKRNGVAEIYLNIIAAQWSCIWGGKGKEDSGWHRFNVFSRITKRRSGSEYCALYVHFAFQGWLRVIAAEGPRVVINALIFISITKIDHMVGSVKSAGGFFSQFWENVEALYNSDDKMSVVTLGTMAFVAIVWIFSILRLLLAAILYICFVAHIVGGDQSLGEYCRKKVDTRMGVIVQKKHEKALAKEKSNNEFLKREPTLPMFMSVDDKRNQSGGLGTIDETNSSTAKLLDHPAPPGRTFSPSPTSAGGYTPSTGYAPSSNQSFKTAPSHYAGSTREPTVPVVYENYEVASAPQPMRRRPTNSSVRTDDSLPYHPPPGGETALMQEGPSYPMQPMPAARSSPSQRLRQNYPDGYGPVKRSGTEPLPPLRTGSAMGQQGGPRSQSARPERDQQAWGGSAAGSIRSASTRPDQGYGPPRSGSTRPEQQFGPRSASARPDQQQGYGGPPPPRSGSAHPEQNYGPPRSGSARPEQQYVPPRSASARPEQQYDYPVSHTPPPRAGSARPHQAGPPPGGYAPPARSGTAPPPSSSSNYAPPQRSHTARPEHQEVLWEGTSREPTLPDILKPGVSTNGGGGGGGYVKKTYQPHPVAEEGDVSEVSSVSAAGWDNPYGNGFGGR